MLTPEFRKELSTIAIQDVFDRFVPTSDPQRPHSLSRARAADCPVTARSTGEQSVVVGAIYCGSSTLRQRRGTLTKAALYVASSAISTACRGSRKSGMSGSTSPTAAF